MAAGGGDRHGGSAVTMRDRQEIDDEEIRGMLSLADMKAFWDARHATWVVLDERVNVRYIMNPSVPHNHWAGVIQYVLKRRSSYRSDQ